MRIFRSARVILFALLVCLIPASSNAAVFVSVAFAPPVLPVYVQPPCPEPGWMWTPGYWAYGPDGYYWVPGTWVPAPEPGLYWTPGYWAWSGGLYVWYPGYWGPTVGYYGGVNYGFGFFGIGFVGGVWHGGVFTYNTAVVHVNTVVIHNVYVDRTVITSHTVVANSHVAFSGGPGGINHPPTAAEKATMNQHHIAATSFQTQHEAAAKANVNAYASHNGGHPANLATARPAPAETHGFNYSKAPSGNTGAHANAGAGSQNRGNGGAPENRPAPQSHPQPTPQSHPQPAPQSHPQPHNNPQPHEQGGGNQGHEHER